VHLVTRPSRLTAARLVFLSAALGVLAALPACIPILAGGAAAGGYVAGQEKGVTTLAVDERIRVEINKLWFNYSSDMSGQLTLAVNSGEVLIAGTVSNPDWKVEAVRLAWQVDGVKKVDSEIEFSDKSGITDLARDKLITYRLRSALVFDSRVRNLNYTIDTVNGVVYLTGSARSQGELDRVTGYARNIPNVRRVVSYVHIRTGEQATAADGSQPAPQAAGQPAGEPPPPRTDAPAPVTSGSGPAKIEVGPLQ